MDTDTDYVIGLIWIATVVIAWLNYLAKPNRALSETKALVDVLHRLPDDSHRRPELEVEMKLSIDRFLGRHSASYKWTSRGLLIITAVALISWSFETTTGNAILPGPLALKFSLVVTLMVTSVFFTFLGLGKVNRDINKRTDLLRERNKRR